MATLDADVTSRISSARLIQLTNPDVVTATTVNTTLLALAVTDVQADFELLGGATYLATNPVHVSLGITGVVAKLHEWTGNGGEWAAAHRDLWYENIKLLRTRSAVVSKSSSQLTPSTEAAQRPALDPVLFGGYTAGGAAAEDPYPYSIRDVGQ